MAQDERGSEGALRGVRALYAWLVDNVPSLCVRMERGEVLKPRLVMYAYASGDEYNVTVSFFVDPGSQVDASVIPRVHRNTLAWLVETDIRSIGFRTVERLRPGSSTIVARHCVWDEHVEL